MADGNVKGFRRRNGVQETGDGGADGGTLGALVVVGQDDSAVAVSTPPVSIDANNTTSTALNASQTYTGTATDISAYNQVNVQIYARPGVVAGDANNASASFYFEFSKDATNWDTSVPALVRDPSLVIPVPIINVHKYFRVRYLNDGGASAIAALGLADAVGTPRNQTVFRLTTYLLPNATKELTRTLDQGISGSDPVGVVRAAVMGKDPDGDIFVNVPASGNVSDNSSTTALTGSNSFTGTWHTRQGYVGISLTIKTDQISATDGIKVEHSDTAAGTTVRFTDSFTFAAAQVTAGQMFITLTPKAQYFRVRYTNGGTNQGSFFLETNLHAEETEAPRQTIEGLITSSSLAEMSRSVANAKDPSGGLYDNITRTTTDGSSRTGIHTGIVKHEVDTPIKALTSWNTGQASVASTSVAVNVIPAPTSGRKSFAVKALSTNGKVIFIGPTAGVTAGNGWELSAGESIVVEVDQTTGVWMIGSTATTVTACFAEIL